MDNILIKMDKTDLFENENGIDNFFKWNIPLPVSCVHNACDIVLNKSVSASAPILLRACCPRWHNKRIQFQSGASVWST